MKIAMALLAAAGLVAAEQNGTVGLSALPVYNDSQPDKQGPAVVVDVIENTARGAGRHLQRRSHRRHRR